MKSPSYSTGRLIDAGDDSLLDSTLEFIWNLLIPWSQDPSRPHAANEVTYNSQFCDFVDTAARKTMPMIRFKHEQPQDSNRSVDMAVSPVEKTWISGTRYTIYQPFLVIEGKRLPAPTSDRKHEYVTGPPGEKKPGGIQRFKLGLHGRDLAHAVLLGYVEKSPLHYWFQTINTWIENLSISDSSHWQHSDRLRSFHISDKEIKSRCESTHSRSEQNPIKLSHFWIKLNSSP